MHSLFAELEREASSEVDGVFGERIRLDPIGAGKYLAGSADGERTAYTVAGVADFDPVTLIAQDSGKYDGLRPAVSGEKIHVSFDEAVFTDWTPRPKDHLVLIDRPTQYVLSVTRMDPDRLGRLVAVCTLVE